MLQGNVVLADKDANDAAANWPAGFRAALDSVVDLPDMFPTAPAKAQASATDDEGYTWSELRRRHGTEYPAPVIEGLLREREILTIVSCPKAGKSMLCYSLALAVVKGEPWLNPMWFPKKGSVVIFDNESDPATMSARLEALREAMGADVDDRLRIFSFFGKHKSIDQLQPYIDRLKADPPVIIIFDSLFYFLPPGADENSNPDMAQVFQTIRDLIVPLGHTAAALVHHAAKGTNAERETIDMGRGAGSIGAATGTMLTLRPHEMDQHFIVEAVCRSWPQPAPATYQFDYPLWHPTDADPRKRKGLKRPASTPATEAPLTITAEEFASFLLPEPQTMESIARSIRDVKRYTRSASVDLVRRIRLKYRVDEQLRPDDPAWMNFGPFEARLAGRVITFRRTPAVVPPLP